MIHENAEQMDEFRDFPSQSKDDITFYSINSEDEGRLPCSVFNADINTRGLIGACSALNSAQTIDIKIPNIAIVGYDVLIYKSFAGLDSFESISEVTRYRAVEVVWHLCIQEYDVGVSAGVPRTRIMKETLDIKVERRQNTTITNLDRKEDFVVTSDYTNLMIFQGNWTNAEENTILKTLENKVFWDPCLIDDQVSDQLERLQELADDMALGITNYLRSNEINGTEVVQGYASIGLIVDVHWQWLLLLGLQVVFTAVFFVYVVVDTARAGVDIIKTPNMAELMAVKTAGTITDSGSDDSDLVAGGIASKAVRDLMGRLVKDGDEWHLEIRRRESLSDKS